MKSLIAAIDLGTTNIVFMVGEKIAGQIKIVACSKVPSRGIMRGDVVNIQNVLESIMPAKQEIESAIGYKINEVFISVSGQYVKCSSRSVEKQRENPDNIITAGEIEAITREMYAASEGEFVLHAIPQSYNIGDFLGITNPVGMTGESISASFNLFTCRANSINLSKNVIARGELVTKGLVLESFATAKAVASADEAELGVAVVNIGGGTTDILILEDKIVRYAAVIPFGGNSITEDIKTGCSVTGSIAEQIKTEYGSCMSNYAPNKTIMIPGMAGVEQTGVSFKCVADIIGARLEEILEAVRYEIEQSGYYNKLKAGVILTGGSSNIGNIIQLSKIVLGLNTRIGTISNTINCSDIYTAMDSSYATAIGLIVAGFEQMEREDTIYNTATKIDYNLFGEEQPAEGEKKGETGANSTEVAGNNADVQSEKKEKDEKKKEKKKKSGFSIKNIFKQIKDNEMFKENEA